MRSTFLAIIILCFAQSTFAQTNFREGYIITNEGDTLSGMVNYNEGSKNYEVCDFKNNSNSERISYYPNQIKAYRFTDDKLLVSKEITQNGTIKNVFMEVLVKGKVTLYKTKKYFYVQKYDTLLRKLSNDPERVLITEENVVRQNNENIGREKLRMSNKHVGILNYFLSDCEGLYQRIKNSRLTERKLISLIFDYNECIGQSNIVYKLKKKWLKSSVGLNLGFNSSSINFKSFVTGNEYLISEFERTNSLLFGINLELFSPRLNERTSFITALYYFNSLYKTVNATSNTRNNVAIQIEQLKIPVGIQYKFPKKILMPYINFGLTSSIHLTTSSLLVQEIEVNSSVIDTSQSQALNIGKTQFGLFGSVGLKKEVFKKNTIGIEIRYEYTNGIHEHKPAPNLTSNINNVQVLIGYTL